VRALGLGYMNKVAVFGNTAGGKSTLARRLAELTRLPWYPLDTIQYRAGGGKVPDFDLPLLTHYMWVTNRLLQGLFVKPEGWPEDSPIWSSTLKLLPCGLALPSSIDSQIPATCGRRGSRKGRPSPAVANCDEGFSRSNPVGTPSPRMRRPAHCARHISCVDLVSVGC
jgi:hypothetical protein